MKQFIPFKFKPLLKANITWLLVIILLLCAVVFNQLLVFDKLLIYTKHGGDSFKQYWPQYHYLVQKFKDGDLSGWSHNIGFGANIFSLGSRFLDPFFIILLLIPLSGLHLSFIYIAILKFVLAGGFFYIYLSRFKLSNYAKLFGGLLYAFNGYMVVWAGAHHQFGTLLVIVPFLLYTFELWVRDRNWIPFYITSVIIAGFNYYFIFLLFLYLLMYGIFRYLEEYDFKIKDFLVFGFETVGIGILALGTAGVFLLTRLAVVFQSSRGFLHLKNFSLFSLNSLSYYITLLFKFFSSDIFRVEEYFGFLALNNGPNVYAGLVTILLIPQLFYLFKKKERKIYGAFLTLMSALLIFPYFSYTLHGFERDAYRWTFMVILLQVYLAARVLDRLLEEKRLNKKYLWGTLTFLIALLATGRIIGETVLKWEAANTRFLTSKIITIAVFLVIYSAVLFFLSQKKPGNKLKLLLVLVICCELGLSVYNNFVNDRSLLTRREMKENNMYYFDNTLKAVKYIKDNEKHEHFFRLSKGYTSGFYNDSLIQDFKGISIYQSSIDKDLIQFLKVFGIDSRKRIRVIKSLNDRLFLETLLNVKYFLTRASGTAPYGYEYRQSFGDVHLYRNKNYLPLGFVYHSYCLSERFDKLSDLEKDKVILSSAVIEEEPGYLKEIEKLDIENVKEMELSEEIVSRQYKVKTFDENKGYHESIIEIPVTADRPGYKYIALHLRLNNGIKSLAALDLIGENGRQYRGVRKIHIWKGMKNEYIYLGTMANIRMLRLRIEKSKNLKIKKIQLKCRFPDEDELLHYTHSIKQLRKNAMQISVLKDDFIQGDIKSGRAGILFFSIPYDKGWTLTVDGRERSLERVNIGFMGCYIEEGQHRIRLKFTPPLFHLGMKISVISILIFFALIILRKKLFNRNKKIDA